MKKKMRKFLLTLSAALLLVTMTVGVTVAYLTDTEKVTNTFTVGNVDIKLNEFDWDNDANTADNEEYTLADNTKQTRDMENTYHLMPGETYIKDPMVTVLKGSEDAFVRVFVTVSNIENIDEIFYERANNEVEGDELEIADFVEGLNAAEWIPQSAAKDDTAANTRTYELRYKAKVTKQMTETENSELTKVFTAIKVPGDLTTAEMNLLRNTTITVKAEAIQAMGFTKTVGEGDNITYVDDVDAAWAAFDEQHPAD